LEQAFGWSEQQALDALSDYLVSTEAGRALGLSLLVPGLGHRRRKGAAHL
jgi:hypothetical protein